ncbi:MAG TPA: hypothetical protein VFZ61_05105, partial [Polyangiales bacterium]
MGRPICSRALLSILALGCALIALGSPAAAQNSPDVGGKPYEYKYALPVFGDKVAKRGITFPLPWGLGLNYAFIDQPVTIDSLQLGINDGEMHDLSEVVKFDRVNSKVHGMNARLDVWLFPFWNVYGLVNYAAKAITDVRLSEPIVLDAGAEQQGGGGGLGTTLAMGFWGIFATVDFNWTMNKMQKLDQPVHTILVTPRVGTKIFRYKTFELTAWVGAMFQRIGVDTQGKIRLSDAIGEPSDELRGKIDDWYDGLPPVRQAAVRALVEQLR